MNTTRKLNLNAPILEVKNLVKLYDNKKGINDLSITIYPGDIYAFVGANGAGKTTTLKSIVGINKLDSGSVHLGTYSLLNNPMQFKKHIAYIPDVPNLLEFYTGLKYLLFICDIYGVPQNVRKTRIEYYAIKLDILNSLNNLISSYSHGMKQKIAIISALIHEPKLFIMDEPFVGLDPVSCYNLKQILNEYVKKGNAVFFSSHILEVVEKLSNKICIIKDGRVLINQNIDKLIGKDDLEKKYMQLINNG